MSLIQRLGTLWKVKLVLTIALAGLICFPYFELQQSQAPSPIVMGESDLPFWPQTVWFYFALYPWMAVSAWLIADRKLARCHALQVALIALVSHLIFYFWPSVVVRPESWAPTWGYDLLRRFDGDRNAIPSLHAAYLTNTLLLWIALWRQDESLRSLRLLVWLTTAAIMLSTLFTHQHVVLDLVAGTALALLVCRRSVQMTS